jgi:hypothetical protein
LLNLLILFVKFGIIRFLVGQALVGKVRGRVQIKRVE